MRCLLEAATAAKRTVPTIDEILCVCVCRFYIVSMKLNAAWSLAINYIFDIAKWTFLGMTAIKSTICDNERHPWIVRLIQAIHESHHFNISSLNLDISSIFVRSLHSLFFQTIFTHVQAILQRAHCYEWNNNKKKTECYLRVVTIKTTRQMWYTAVRASQRLCWIWSELTKRKRRRK